MEKFSNSLILDNETVTSYSGELKNYPILDNEAATPYSGEPKNYLILDNEAATPYSGEPKNYLILDNRTVRRQRGMVARILYTPATRLTEVLPSATDILPMPCLPSSTFSL